MINFVGSDPKIIFAFWLGVGVTVMTLVMLAVIIIMRKLVLRRERIHAEAVALWETVLVPTLQGVPVDTPRLEVRDVSGFIQVWNRVHEPLHGRTSQNLSRIAGETDLESHLFQFMSKGSFHDRLVAIIALGHIKSNESFRRVSEYIDDKSPII